MASKSRPYEQFGSFILFKRLETDALGDLWRAGKVDGGVAGGQHRPHLRPRVRVEWGSLVRLLAVVTHTAPCRAATRIPCAPVAAMANGTRGCCTPDRSGGLAVPSSITTGMAGWISSSVRISTST